MKRVASWIIKADAYRMSSQAMCGLAEEGARSPAVAAYRCGRLRGLSASAVAIIILISSHCVWGAGLELYETGAPDLGTASAGRAAMAGDASTAG